MAGMAAEACCSAASRARSSLRRLLFAVLVAVESRRRARRMVKAEEWKDMGWDKENRKGCRQMLQVAGGGMCEGAEGGVGE